jgi:hypothetical protein
MIYLIITTSIFTKYNNNDNEQRKNQYISSITNTLQHLPSSIKPIIVENNGLVNSFLDNFGVSVHYTNNNNTSNIHKGVNELDDIKSVIKTYDIKPDDFIIKITGRYHVLNNTFFNNVITNENEYDVFIKCFNVCTQQFIDNDCVLGLFAIKCKYIIDFSYICEQPPEVEFASYCNNLHLKINKINDLSLCCQFADDLRILNI